MPNEDDFTRRMDDRDLLVDIRAELRHVKENQNKFETSLDVRLENMDARIESRFMRQEKELYDLKDEVEKLKQAYWTSAGGIGFGKWIVATLPTLPIVGGLAGWIIAKNT